MSDLAALLASGQVKEVLLLSNPDSELGQKVLTAARERLRLSKVPCETCGGKKWPETTTCLACNGSGEVWPADIRRVVTTAIVRPLEDGENRTDAVLDAIDRFAKEPVAGGVS